MTITLLDLYNTAATQEWSMYDNDALSDAEFEDSLVLSLNKAILEIFASYKFPFRERTHIVLTVPKMDSYDMPQGLIKRDIYGRYIVKYNSELLELIDNPSSLEPKIGVPDGFYIQNDQIVLYPAPVSKGFLAIDYYTVAIGENSNNEEIYALKNDTDILYVPVHLEELMKNAIITRAMLNTIASEGDENYSAYKKQADKALKLLIKYSKGVEPDKEIKI